MTISLVQILLITFLTFALSRVFLRFRGGSVSMTGFIFWSLLFILAIIAVIKPDLTTRLAKSAGIGRGVDAVVYSSIVLLFYLVFRIHIFLEDIKNDITSLVRKMALKELKKRNGQRTTKD